MTITILNASAHNLPLANASVHCIVTSPPYYSLRKYAGEQEIDWPAVEYKPISGPLYTVFIPPMRASLGLESTPDAYIGHLVLVFRELARVLRPDGVAWAVMGDSFTSGGRSTHGTRVGYKQQTNHGMSGKDDPPRNDSGMDDGNLMLIPHRLALALQADGWTVRNDVVWAKVAPMPESVAGWSWQRHKVKLAPGRPAIQPDHIPTDGLRPGGNRGNNWSDVQNQPNAKWSDCSGCPTCTPNDGYVLRRGSWRHTRAHEFVFMLTRGMGYWANGEAVRESSTGQQGASANFQRTTKDCLLPGQSSIQHRIDREPTADNGSRNPRSVLTPSPESYSGSHYAVFPTSLIAPLIRATCPARCCPVCGAGWAPCIEIERFHAQWGGPALKDPQVGIGQAQSFIRDGLPGCTSIRTAVLAYRPTCTCPAADSIPGTVLDPFVGSGTTLAVARELGLSAIGVDLSLEYLDQHAKPRGAHLTPSNALDTLPLFNP